MVKVETMASTHAGAREVINTILSKYEGNPNVAVDFYRFNETTRKADPISLRDYATLPVQSIESLRKKGNSILEEELLKSEQSRRGHYSRSLLESVKSRVPSAETNESKANPRSSTEIQKTKSPGAEGSS